MNFDFGFDSKSGLVFDAIPNQGNGLVLDFHLFVQNQIANSRNSIYSILTKPRTSSKSVLL